MFLLYPYNKNLNMVIEIWNMAMAIDDDMASIRAFSSHIHMHFHSIMSDTLNSLRVPH